MPTPTLEYVTVEDVATAGLRAAMRPLLWVAILSGLCVGSCFMVMAADFSPGAATLHLCLYAATVGMAVIAGQRLTRIGGPGLRSPARMALDVVAGAGLAMLAIAPFFAHTTLGQSDSAALVLGAAYALIAFTTMRHLLLYRGLSSLFHATGYHGLGRFMTTLGWIKLIYEGLWLSCCTAALFMIGGNVHGGPGDMTVYFAIGSFFGCFGFGVVWILMIVAHARALFVARKIELGDRPRAFEVIPIEPAVPAS